ncbi:MAG: hypothetical protein RBR18_14110 [Desulfovibrionaceae bacterium]|nr:hypothetical protein [Desulfovibrionaceae bacterium]
MERTPATESARGKSQGHPPRKRRLKSLDDLRRFLADVLNRLEAGELDDAAAKTRAYVVNILSAVVKDSDIEARLAALEAAQQKEKTR